ncbi:laminin subunit beta-3 [Electrophorus electricus]|uniref:laminin subunit beta-3 n=1 Tax=Electrophorus electricus TaxID=8005 RepID=UPI0015D03FE8|nr:laminin subunit beta-3 [Electrophorus electricus]
MKVWIFLQLAVVAAMSQTQQDCVRGACYPPIGDLLHGREQQLSASSTCGLIGTEVFCTPFEQWKMKCCPCDSRNPAARNAHTIQNVLSSAGPDRWWQSRKGVNPVSLLLDLQQLFQLDTLLLSFKGPRPSALLIERTADFGRTWQPALYMAIDCPSAYPKVAMTMPSDLGTTYCYTLPASSANPYQDQKIYFHPLQQYSKINYSDEYKIEEVTAFTGLRVNLTQLGEVPRTPGRNPSQFYALKEMKVMGSCFCHGHANRCLPKATSSYPHSTEVNGVCECQHNTAGLNCERCADLYNDHPWRPAKRDNPHTCKRCECNNHAQRCRFDSELYKLSGRRSGGVCVGCQHHTTGPRCEQCIPNYYRNPHSNMQSPDACLRCQCDSMGSEKGGQCDQVTGACLCKANVEGARCDRCKPGYFGLSTANPLGCSKCSCSTTGSLHGMCDPVTGQCACRPKTEGLSCDRCTIGLWNPSSPSGCQPCDCYPNNALSHTCDQQTGQCLCREGFSGRTCGGCPDNTFGDPLIGCKPCQCDSTGTVPGGCDKDTGVCHCKRGVTGVHCNTCARGHCASFPQCPTCPSCFVHLDAQLQSLTLDFGHLASTLLSATDGAGADVMGRIRELELTLLHLQDSLKLPAQSENFMDNYVRHLQRLWSKVRDINLGLHSTGPTPDLQGELEKLQNLLSELHLVYNAKVKPGTNYAGAWAAVRKAYNKSTDAAGQAEATGDAVNKASSIRDDAMKSLNRIQPGNTNNLETLSKVLATLPNLTPTAVQVCSSSRLSICTPQDCRGELCPAGGVPPCIRGERCVGALPQGSRAMQDSEEVKAKLQQLNDKITQAYSQIQDTQASANRVRLSTEELTNQIKRARDDMDDDMKDTKNFIRRLKDFLSDPVSDPGVVQRVCEGVLGMRLPETAEALKRKLQEMQDLAASLPDSSRVLNTAGPQLEQARNLLQDAENARDVALELQENAETLLTSLDENESTITDMEEKLRESQDIVDSVKQDVQKSEQVLEPAEGLVGELPGLLEAMHPLLEGLIMLTKRGGVLATEAVKQADGAEEEANNAAQDLLVLQDQLVKLKQASKDSDGAGAARKRLQALQQDTTALIQDTTDTIHKLTDKEESLQRGAADLLMNVGRLEGLDAQVQELLTDIRTKATRLTMCQG